MTGDDVTAPTVEAMVEFARAVPVTRRILSDHIACNDELLPHVFMADLRQFLVDLVADDDHSTLTVFLNEIERLASSDDPNVRNLVDVSFIEDLVRGDPAERAAIDAIRTRIGPATTISLERGERDVR